jgi:hypothetical protein
MADAQADFGDWRALLAETLAIAREIGVHASVLATLEAVIGDPDPQDWRHSTMGWRFEGDDKRWDEAAKAAVAAVPAVELGKAVEHVFRAQLRLQQLHDTHLDHLLLKRAYATRAGSPRLVRQAWGTLVLASRAVLLAALRRKPALDDAAALSVLRALQNALLHWIANFVSEPDLPLRNVFAWVAEHRFEQREMATHVLQRIVQVLALLPAADAEDRRYVARLGASAQALGEQLSRPVEARADGVAPLDIRYPAAHFHRDWDALVKAEMKRLGFERVKGAASRWRRPRGERWVHVGFFPGKWGWSTWAGGDFRVAVDLSVHEQADAVDPRESIDFFGVFPDEAFAPLLALNAAARDTVRRLVFDDAMNRQLHEGRVLQDLRHPIRRIRGDIQPDLAFYDPAGLAAWSAFLLPAIASRLDEALAAADPPPA